MYKERIFPCGVIADDVQQERHLGRRVVVICIGPTRNDSILLLRGKIDGDTAPDAMDKRLEEGIIKNIPATASEM